MDRPTSLGRWRPQWNECIAPERKSAQTARRVRRCPCETQVLFLVSKDGTHELDAVWDMGDFQVMRLLAVLCMVGTLALPLRALADIPVTSSSGSFTATGTYGQITLAGQSHCSVSLSGTGAGIVVVPQGSNDLGVVTPVTWTTVTSIGDGSLTANTSGSGVVGNIASFALRGFQLNVTGISSGTENYVVTCSPATNSPSSAICSKGNLNTCATVTTPGASATDALSVQGIAGGTSLPVSVVGTLSVALPFHSITAGQTGLTQSAVAVVGSNGSTNDPLLVQKVGTNAAAATSGALVVQGSSNGQALPVSCTAANCATNLSQVGGSAYTLGPTTAAGAAPVVLPKDTNPCLAAAPSFVFGQATVGGGITRIISGSTGKQTYICAITVGMTGSSPSFQLQQGTGATCGSTPPNITALVNVTQNSNYMSNGPNPFAATTTAADDTCITVTGSSGVGNYTITYVQI